MPKVKVKVSYELPETLAEFKEIIEDAVKRFNNVDLSKVYIDWEYDKFITFVYEPE